MRSLFCRSIVAATVVTGLVTLVSPAAAQGKPAAPTKGAPAKPVPPKAPEKGAPAKAAPAKPAGDKGAKPGKPLTEAQKKDGAKKAFEEGGKKFDAGDFQGAYAAFKEADDLVPGAVPKYRMAESLEKAGDVPGAIKAYEDFLASNPPADKQQARIDGAKQKIEALKKSPADVKVTVTPANATLALDGAAQTANPIKVPPGKHTISAKADGFEEGKVDVEVAAAEKKEVTLSLNAAKPVEQPVAVEKKPEPPPIKPEKPATPEKSGSTSKVPAIITLSLAGAGAVVGTVFGVMALGSKSDYNKTPTQDLYDKTERNALIADMSYGVAITFGVTGLVLLLSGHDDAPAAQEKKASVPKPGFFVLPWAGTKGGGALGTVTF